jgi:hypothetical protein
MAISAEIQFTADSGFHMTATGCRSARRGLGVRSQAGPQLGAIPGASSLKAGRLDRESMPPGKGTT